VFPVTSRSKSLISHALLVISVPPAKAWLLERGVGSLWLAINVIAGGGIAVLIWITLRGGVKVKGAIKVCVQQYQQYQQ
jgi:hypothetical protein